MRASRVAVVTALAAVLALIAPGAAHAAAAPRADDMSGTNENTLPAWMAPKTVVWRATKNWKVPYSWEATRREPYQKTSAMTKNDIACVTA